MPHLRNFKFDGVKRKGSCVKGSAKGSGFLVPYFPQLSALSNQTIRRIGSQYSRSQ